MACPKHPNRTLKEWNNGTQLKCTATISEGPPKKYCDWVEPMTAQAAGLEPLPGDAPTQTTALTTLPSMPGWLAKPLEQFIGNPAFELILPSVPVNAEIGYGHRVAVSVVQISANPDDKEVFQVGSRNGAPVYAYTKQALEKMAEAAGIQIRTERRDDRRDPEYAEVQAIAGMKGSNGQSIIRTATKAFRMADVRAEALRNRMKLRGEDEATARQAVAAEMTAFQKHLLARTESGAMLRAIRSLLAIKGGLTAAQISRPKVLVRVEFNPDSNDPVVKRFMLEKGYEAQSALYLPPPGTRQIDVAEVEEDDDSEGFEQEPLQLGNAPMEDADERDYLALVTEACRSMGIATAEKNALFVEHKGDLKAIWQALNARGTR